jgi:hypothetical protein
MACRPLPNQPYLRTRHRECRTSGLCAACRMRWRASKRREDVHTAAASQLAQPQGVDNREPMDPQCRCRALHHAEGSVPAHPPAPSGNHIVSPRATASSTITRRPPYATSATSTAPPCAAPPRRVWWGWQTGCTSKLFDASVEAWRARYAEACHRSKGPASRLANPARLPNLKKLQIKIRLMARSLLCLIRDLVAEKMTFPYRRDRSSVLGLVSVSVVFLGCTCVSLM